jgi:hypothetical protein
MLRAVAFATDAHTMVILATYLNSLARYSKRTMQPLRAASHYTY